MATASRQGSLASSLQTLVSAAVAAGVLAGCSGGVTSVSPVAARSQSASTMVRPASASLAPAPAGTLYLAGFSAVYAFPLGASGATSSTRTITPHPNQSRHNESLAINADGTLDVLQQVFDGTGTLIGCQVVVEAASASGSPAALQNVWCDASQKTNPGQVRRNALGGFDVAYYTPSGTVINRYASDGASLSSTWTSLWGTSLATDAGGHDYVHNSSGEIFKYRSSATSNTESVADCIVPVGAYSYAYYGMAQLAVAPDKTIYAVVNTGASPALNPEIVAITSCGTGGAAATVSRTIGPFTNMSVDVIATDAEGELYVAMHASSPAQIVVRVYAPDANNAPTTGAKPAPVRIINPVMPNEGWIHGMAISE